MVISLQRRYHEFFVKSGLLRTNHGVTDGRDLDWHGLMGAGIIQQSFLFGFLMGFISFFFGHHYLFLFKVFFQFSIPLSSLSQYSCLETFFQQQYTLFKCLYSSLLFVLGARLCVGRKGAYLEWVGVQILGPYFILAACVLPLKADYPSLRPCATIAGPRE